MYRTLARLSDGEAVCEVPFGFGDGMGDTGSPARDILYYATLHEHPLVGGSIGRKPPDAAAAYSNIPVLDTLLRFSSGSAAPAIADGTSRPMASGESNAPLPCRYVVIDRATASSESVDYLQRTLPLAFSRPIPAVKLYRVERPERSAARKPDGQFIARTAQRSFAEAARRLANVSAFVERITSVATSEYTPARRPAWNAFFTRRSSPE